jgi:hypothetical protein
MKFGVLAIILATAGLAACGDAGGTKDRQAAASAPAATNSGPDRTEGKVEQAVLEGFSPFLPAEVNGWKKQDRLGYYSGETGSTATATYRKPEGGPAISIAITLSNQTVTQTKQIIADTKQADMFGLEATTFAGYPALSGKEGGQMAGTAWTVVLSNSRMVQAMFNPEEGLKRDDVRAVFEKVDFKGIADK